jgi:hypothetical protein
MQFLKKCSETYIFTYVKEIYLSVLILLVAGSCFGLGRLSITEEKKQPVTIGYVATSTPPIATNSNQTNSVEPSKPIDHSGMYVAARGGKAYYIPTCLAATRIKEENKVWFATKEEAEKAGYKPASNCPGL